MGGSEEILGTITRKIQDIAENYRLSEKDRQEKLQQLADNQIRLIREQEELEQRQVELFGIRLPEDRMRKEIEDASSFWLSPASILKFVSLYLLKSCGKGQEFILGEKPLKTLRLSQDARNTLLSDLQKLPRQNTILYRDWEKWLKGSNPYLVITYEPDCAVQHPEAAFIIPIHPLVRQAARSFQKNEPVFARLTAESAEVPAGRYEFAIYQWRFLGIREDLVLRLVSSSEALTKNLGPILEKAVDQTSGRNETDGLPSQSELDAMHYKLWHDARVKHRQRTRELAEFRRESLSTSHRARIALLEEQLSQATNEKIQRMRQSQIAAAEADYARRIQELEIAMEKADVVAELVGFGILRIEK